MPENSYIWSSLRIRERWPYWFRLEIAILIAIRKNGNASTFIVNESSKQVSIIKSTHKDIIASVQYFRYFCYPAVARRYIRIQSEYCTILMWMIQIQTTRHYLSFSVWNVARRSYSFRLALGAARKSNVLNLSVSGLIMTKSCQSPVRRLIICLWQHYLNKNRVH